MDLTDFIKAEGLQKLALARLSASSFAILIYLLGEVASGANEIVSSRKELSILLGWSEKNIGESLQELQFYHLILLVEVPGKPLRMQVNLDFHSWNSVGNDKADTKKPQKPLLGDTTNLHALHGGEAPVTNGMTLRDYNMPKDPIPFPEQLDTKNLCGKKKYHGEASLNDLHEFREKHDHINLKIKALALSELDVVKNENRTLNRDEELLLQILSQHHDPRKQLLLALHSNIVYPNLNFFLNSAKVCAGIPEQ